MTSRSNCANESSTLRVNRPIDCQIRPRPGIVDLIQQSLNRRFQAGEDLFLKPVRKRPMSKGAIQGKEESPAMDAKFTLCKKNR
jgi:hypothetical protein